MSGYVSDMINAVRDEMDDKNAQIACLKFDLSILVAAAKDYADQVLHERGCPVERCDCGYETLMATIKAVSE